MENGIQPWSNETSQISFIFLQKRSPVHPDLVFNGTAVTKVDEHEHLGLILQSKLSFNRHLNEKMTKAKRIIGILKHLSKFLPLRLLIKCIKLLYVDYCDIIYHMPKIVRPLGVSLHELMESVEKIQYQASLAITDCWKGSSHDRLYDELGWESLSDRRNINRIFQIYKIISKPTLSYLKDKLPPFCYSCF